MSPVLSHRVRLYSTSPQPRSSAEQTAAHPPHSCRHLHHNTACLSFSETPHGLLTCHTYQPLACACLWFASCTYPHFFPGEQVTEVKGTLIGVASVFQPHLGLLLLLQCITRQSRGLWLVSNSSTFSPGPGIKRTASHTHNVRRQGKASLGSFDLVLRRLGLRSSQRAHRTVGDSGCSDHRRKLPLNLVSLLIHLAAKQIRVLIQ